MPLLLRYRRETGTIEQTWESNSVAVVLAQQGAEEPEYGYLLCTAPLTASVVEQDYQVVDGAVVLRPVVREER